MQLPDLKGAFPGTVCSSVPQAIVPGHLKKTVTCAGEVRNGGWRQRLWFKPMPVTNTLHRKTTA